MYKITPRRLHQASPIADLFQNRVFLPSVEQMLQRALAGKEKALGADHASTLNTVHDLGILYGDQGKLNQAELIYQRAGLGKEERNTATFSFK